MFGVTTTMADMNLKKPNRRPTVHISPEVDSRLDEYVAKFGGPKQEVVDAAVDATVYVRQNFIKAYAPHLTLEHSTLNAIYIHDNELQKTAVVKAKWRDLYESGKDKTNNRSLLTIFCELCESENCIHVRYSLILPEMPRIIN